jgi:hypothetical protein
VENDWIFFYTGNSDSSQVLSKCRNFSMASLKGNPVMPPVWFMLVPMGLSGNEKAYITGTKKISRFPQRSDVKAMRAASGDQSGS